MANKPLKNFADGHPLTASDRKKLNALRIPNSLIKDAGLFRVTDKEARKFGFRFDEASDLSGIVFPYRDADGEVFNMRLRRDKPEHDIKGKEENKYIKLPKPGGKPGLYWPPGAEVKLQEDSSCEVIAVEAEKSALAITAYAKREGRRLVAVATGGAWGWRERLSDVESRPLPELERFRGRRFHVMMDGNVVENEHVQRGEMGFAAHMSVNVHAQVDIRRLPVEHGVNGPDDYLARHKDIDFCRLLQGPPFAPWLDVVGESYEKYKNAKPPEFVIKNFLQSQGATLIAGLSGHGKTFLLLSVVQSLLTGAKLFGYFPVLEKAKRVIYLTPEISLGQFKIRAQKFKLDSFIENRQLLVRTLSAFPMLELTDEALLMSAQGCDVFLDTVIRFAKGDENSSTENNKGLAAGIFRLLECGARTVTGAAHSPKGFEKSDSMSLENVLRGTGDIGAMLSTAWGVRLLDRDKTIIHVENIKPRDFEPPRPFQLQGIPSINDGRGFQMYKEPGECGYLKDNLPKHTGRPPDPKKVERRALLLKMSKAKRTFGEIKAAVAERWDIKDNTLRKEIAEVRAKKF